MAVARCWWFAAKIRFVELRPKQSIFEEMVNSVSVLGRLGVVREFVVGVVQREEHRKRNKLRSEGIEGRTRTVTGNTRRDRRFRLLLTNR